MSDDAEFLAEYDAQWEQRPRSRTARRLSPAVRAALVRAVLDGLNRTEAAIAAGITPATFARWMRRGERASSGPEFELVQVVEAAEAQLERLLIGAIRKAAYAGDWRAAEALLKRRFPDRWGDRQRIDHHVILEEAKKLASEFPELTEEEILAEAYAVLEGRG